MSFRKSLIPSLLLSCMLSQSVIAGDFTFIPRTWIGISDYTFKQDARKGAMAGGGDFPKVEFNVTFKMLGVGFTTAYDDYYFDLSYQDSMDESDTFGAEKLEGDRRDYSVTAGMRVLENRGNIYFGYKNGRSEANGNLGTDLSFEEDGYFIGASYGWIIANAGILSINAAYADLDGTLKETPGPSYQQNPYLGMDADSEATGVSYGISWSGNISKTMGYSISFDANDYEFDNLKDNSTNVALPDKIEETFYTSKVSISYRF